MNSEILRVLSERHSRVVFRDELFREVWGFLDTSTTRSVDRAVSRLRQKIEADPRTPRFLRTVHGDGYIRRRKLSFDAGDITRRQK